MRDIGQRKSAEYRCIENSGVIDCFDRQVHDVFHRLAQWGLLDHMRHHRQRLPTHLGRNATIQTMEQRLRGALASFVHIDMRISAIAIDDITVVHHRCGQVGMKIECNRNRYPRGDFPDAA